MELPRKQLSPQRLLSLFLSAWQIDDNEVGCPPLELLHPVGDGGLGRNNQVGLIAHILAVPNVAEDRYCHDCFTQAHVVCQNSIHFVLSQRCHPL